jgi:surface polysaccharide O-acyltransferase-like enzyme
MQNPIHPSAPAPNAPALGLVIGLELARSLAAFFIVWDHSFAPGWQYCDPALSLFVFLTAYLSMQSYERAPGPAFWQKRLPRLLLPWLFWCLIFRLIYEVILDEPGDWHLLSEPLSLLIGPMIHLWFLPFCALALVFVPVVMAITKSQRTLVISLILFGLLAFALNTLYSPATLPEPLSQWTSALPIYLLGLIHARARTLDQVWLSLTAALVLALAFWQIWPTFWVLQPLFGIVLFELARALPVTAPWPVALAKRAFGVYLIHPAFNLLAFKIWDDVIGPVSMALFAYAGSLLATEIALRLPYLRKTV